MQRFDLIRGPIYHLDLLAETEQADQGSECRRSGSQPSVGLAKKAKQQGTFKIFVTSLLYI